MTTTTGPAELFLLAERLRTSYGFELASVDCAQLAAVWELEVCELRAALERVTLDQAVLLSKQADSLLRAERAEAALDAEQRTRLATTRTWQKNEAALEQARALASRWRDTLCLFPNLEAMVDEIDALLAAAPGGAA